MVLVLAVGTTRGACAAAAAAACYTGRYYCRLLAVRKRVRRAAACYTYCRVTCCRLLLALIIPSEIQDVSRNVIFSPESTKDVIFVTNREDVKRFGQSRDKTASRFVTKKRVIKKMWPNANLSLNVALVRNDPNATSTAGWRSTTFPCGMPTCVTPRETSHSPMGSPV